MRAQQAAQLVEKVIDITFLFRFSSLTLSTEETRAGADSQKSSCTKAKRRSRENQATEKRKRVSSNTGATTLRSKADPNRMRSLEFVFFSFSFSCLRLIKKKIQANSIAKSRSSTSAVLDKIVTIGGTLFICSLS